MSWRVVREMDSAGESWTYRIEDVVKEMFSERLAFAGWVNGPLCASSKDELRKRLREMLKALDEPMLELTKPVLREVAKR
jgi:hypothetical protein